MIKDLGECYSDCLIGYGTNGLGKYCFKCSEESHCEKCNEDDINLYIQCSRNYPLLINGVCVKFCDDEEFKWNYPICKKSFWKNLQKMKNNFHLELFKDFYNL